MSKIGRDAGSGQFVPVKVAQANPKGAVVETIRRTPAGSNPPAPKKGK